MGELNYIDTDVLIAYSFENHPLHNSAVKLLEGLDGELVISEVSVLELIEILKRIQNDIDLGIEIQPELKLYFLLEYILKISGVKVITLKHKARNIKLIDEILQLHEPFFTAIRISIKSKLDILRSLHIAVAFKIGVDTFVTFDEEILKKKEDIKSLYRITIIGP